MYHSIIFGEKNTWDDWHLIPTSRPVFVPPAPKTFFVDIPGGNGAVDLTDSLLGEPVYSNREGAFEFIVANDYWPSWIDCYTEIMEYLHGKRMEAILEDEPEYSYIGRFSVSDWTSNTDGTWSNISIDYVVDPFKYKQEETKTYTVSQGTIKSIPIAVDKAPIVPTLRSTAEMEVKFGKETFVLPPNVDKTFHDIRLRKGASNITVTGNGSITIKYRNGVL